MSSLLLGDDRGDDHALLLALGLDFGHASEPCPFGKRLAQTSAQSEMLVALRL